MKDTEYYLNGIKHNDLGVLNDIYDNCSKPIVNYVKKNSGSEDDAWDVLQEGLLIIFKKIKKDELSLTAGFGTYLFSVCRYVWLQKLNKKAKEEVTFKEISKLTVSKSIEETYLEVERQKVFDRSLAQLSTECQEIMQLFFLKISAKDISKKMNYTLEYVKRKKYKCKEKLVSIVKNDKEYIDLLKDK